MAITEAVIGALGAQITGYDKAKAKPARVGNGSTNNAPRNVYRCADGTWVAVSAPAQSVAERVITLVGRPDLVDEPWFATGTGRVRHRTLIDELVGGWIADRDRDEVVAAFDRAEAAVAPVYEVDDVLDDPHFRAREVAVRVPDGELGTVLMQNVPFRLSETPGRVRWAGPPLGAHTDELLARLSAEQGTTSGT